MHTQVIHLEYYISAAVMSCECKNSYGTTETQKSKETISTNEMLKKPKYLK